MNETNVKKTGAPDNSDDSEEYTFGQRCPDFSRETIVVKEARFACKVFARLMR